MCPTSAVVQAKLPEDVFCATFRYDTRARPPKGSDRGKRDLTLIVRRLVWQAKCFARSVVQRKSGVLDAEDQVNPSLLPTMLHYEEVQMPI